MNILYIHGFNSSSNSGTYKKLTQLFPEENWFADDYDLTDFDGTVAKIKATINEKNINCVIGSSLGAFYELYAAGDLPCIVINPCMCPSVEIKKLFPEISDDIVKTWEEHEKGMKEYVSFGAVATNMNEMRCNAFGIFGNHDELFSYKDLFEEIYGAESASLKKSFLVEGGHHSLSNEVLKKYVGKAFEYFQLNREYFGLAQHFFPAFDEAEEEEYFTSIGKNKKAFYKELDEYNKKREIYNQD